MLKILYIAFGAPELVVLLIAIVVMALIFFAIRSLMLWYWKIDIVVSNLSLNNDLLRQQIALLQKQVELLENIEKQSGNNPTDPNSEPLRL